MPVVTASIEIAVPPEEPFAVIADPQRRRRLLPDNFRDFRVVSETTNGPGTRTAFRIATPEGDHPSEIELIAWDPPHSLTEQALGDSPYTIHWSFESTPVGAHVTARMDYTVTGTIFHRIIERWFARRALQQSLMVELLRLKTEVEKGVG